MSLFFHIHIYSRRVFNIFVLSVLHVHVSFTEESILSTHILYS